MVKRICPKCNAIFNQKSHYDNHMNKKFDCSPNSHHANDLTKINQNSPKLTKINQNSPKLTKINQNSENYPNILNSNFDDLTEMNEHSTEIKKHSNNCEIIFCSFCNKKMVNKYSLLRHLKDRCKVKKSNDEEKENIYKLLLERDKRIEQLEKQNKILIEKIDKLTDMKEHSEQSKIINNKIITNNISNTQNNFVMVNFGKEDLNIIDERLFIDRIIKKQLLSGVKIPDEVLKIIHFNPMYPQLSNIYISDINRDKCMVYEDNEWKLSNVDNIPLIIDKICLFSTDQIKKIREKNNNNKALNDRLEIIEKYKNLMDNDYLEDLKDENNNEILIERCQNFQKLTYKTIKNTLYNEGKKLKLKKNIKST